MMCRTLLVLALSCGLAAAQAQLLVPSQHATIQSAIAAASPGDVVTVAPGVYLENIDFLGKDITVRGTPGVPGTVIDGSSGPSVVTMQNGEGPGAILEDLVIEKGNGSPTALGADGGGIFLAGSSPTIRRCTIRNNVLFGATQNRMRGGGIFGVNASPTIRGCVIDANLVSVTTGAATLLAGGGLAFFGAAAAPIVIDGCEITNNGASGGGPCLGGGMFAEGAVLLVSDTLFGANLVGASNAAEAHGGGLHVGCNAQATVTHSRFLDNTVLGPANSLVPTGGGGFFVDANALVADFSECLVARNTAPTSHGGGAIFEGFNVTLDGITMSANSAQSEGGLFCSAPLSFVFGIITNSILWGNVPTNLDVPAGAAASLFVSYCDVGGGWPAGSNIIDADPLYVDPANGDFRLTWSSPCVDTGCCGLSPTDLEGDPRGFGLARDMGADEFYGLGGCGISRLGAGFGGALDLLTINGSMGGHTRRVTIGVGKPVTIAVVQPPTNPQPMLFYIALFLGVAPPDAVYTLPAGLGDFCFPLPLLVPGFPGVFNLTSNFGPLPGQLLASTPAPWSIAGPGFPFPFTVTMQGIGEETPGTVKVFNGIVMEIAP